MYEKNSIRKAWNISIEEKVCFNCKHRIWAVAIGAGIRCGKDYINGWPKPIPGVRKSCEAFEVSRDVQRELQLKKTNLLLTQSLTDRIREYLPTEEKTLEEILKQLNELQDSREDRAGAIMRIIKFQRGNANLTESQELELIDFQNLKILISDVEELKDWASEN